MALALFTSARLPLARDAAAHRRSEFRLQNSVLVSRPVYDIVLVAHVAAALIGFGAIAAGGLAASAARRASDPASDDGIRRFFKRAPDWPARAIFLVPVLGLILLLGGDRAAMGDPWPWIGLGLWVVAAGVATAQCWPAERRAQEALAALCEPVPCPSEVQLRQFRDACQRMELAVGAISVCFVAAILVMVLQP